MIHLFPVEGGHLTFKRSVAVSSGTDIDMDEKEVLWITDAFVAWRQDTLTFIRLPWARVKTLHESKKAGEDWPSAMG